VSTFSNGLKKAARTVRRPRVLLVALVAAAGATPIIVSTGGAQSDAPPVSNPAHPVVDANWIYANDWYNATHFIYKRAGSDGCLPGATSCAFGSPGDSNNLPQNYNGDQEFNEWWANLGSSSTPQPNGVLGKWISKRSHLYAQSTYQINVQELTIPGATCPGQQVMLAFHPDSQNVSAPNPGTSATPYQSMYSGDWGTGSPYDSNMGALMNLEEIGSVLRWHEANGTYPKRTIESAVYDAELQGLIGSGDYSSSGGPTTLLLPMSAGSTHVFVTAGAVSNAANTTTSAGAFGIGQPVAIDDANTFNDTVANVTTAGLPTPASSITTLAAAASPGDTNIKVAAVQSTGNNPAQFFRVGSMIRVENPGATNMEMATVKSIGTAGANGTGVTLTAPLTKAHASGATTQDMGLGFDLATPVPRDLPAGTSINGPNAGLISDGPQGQIVGVLNNDQNGINYPALHWGTDHYLNDLVNGGVGPWFNNINATPVVNTGRIYTADGFARLQANLANVTAFRTNVTTAVTNAIHDLGEKYNYSIPVENPLMFKNTGSTPDNPHPSALPSYLPTDQAKYTPVNDDQTGRTDQVSFGNRGIPSLGNIGVYDSSTDPAVGGNENPYPSSYASKPAISFLYGQDTMSDNFPNLNFYAGGEVHGPGGYDKPSEGLLRGVEFVATYFSYAVSSDALGGKVPKPNRPIAYFEQNPKKATTTNTVTYDAGFSRDANGDTKGLTYYWDFGDGSAPQKTNNPTITHTFPTQAGWHDVKLLVSSGDGTKTTSNVGDYRQEEPINFFPTYYPATPPAGEPQPPTSGPQADPCGQLSADELSSFVNTANGPVQGGPIQNGDIGGNVPATLSLSLGPAASFGSFTPGVAKNYDASTTANVISTAGDAALSVSGPNHLTNGAFTMPQPFTVTLSKSSWSAPVSNDPVSIGFHQPIAANDALRTGNYSATVTLTLSTTTP
jgi:hypothetical protein